MSKLSLTGNASGTGTFTIAAPDSNDDRTLTLPDEAGTVLTSASDITQNSGPAFSANTVTAQSVSNATFTKIQFNVEDFDTDSAYDNATNYRFTPAVAGYYQINGNISFSGTSTGYVQFAIYKNSQKLILGSGIPNNTSVGGMVTVSSVVFLNGSSDYVELYAWQNSGGSLALQTATGSNTFSGALVRSV